MPFVGALFLACAVMLGYFCYRRFLVYADNPGNVINYHYWQAALFISLGFLFYALPSIVAPPNTDAAIAAGAVVATILNALGFSHFFMIPLYSTLSKPVFTVGKHVLFLYTTVIALMLIALPPASYLDQFGIIHWRFSAAVAWAMLALIGSAFALNIMLLMRYLARLKRFSFVTTLSLLITFATTGLGGGYLYIGDDAVFLAVSTILLYIGVASIFFASVLAAAKHRRGEDILAG